jgi:DNA end-binding protein Ku
MKMARLLVEAMQIDKPDLEQYRDSYADRLREVIEAKVAGQQIVDSPAGDMSDRVINLMEALEKSLRQSKAEKPVKRRKTS